MKKKILAIISIIVITAIVFASCTANSSGSDEEEVLNTVDKVSESNTIESVSDAESIIQPEVDSTETTTKGNKQTTVQNLKTTVANKQTTKKAESAVKKEAPATTERKETTTKKETTTQKKTTSPPQKNVSPAEVQKQVNDYIRSKGIKVDSEMTPENASWDPQTAGQQKDLNSGYTLKNCKDEVDWIIEVCGKESIVSMYCYYEKYSDGDWDFYVLYW